MALDFSVLKSAIQQAADYSATTREGELRPGYSIEERLLVVDEDFAIIPDDEGNDIRTDSKGNESIIYKVKLYSEKKRVLTTDVQVKFVDWDGSGFPELVQGMHANAVLLKPRKGGGDWMSFPNISKGVELGLYADPAAAPEPEAVPAKREKATA